MKLETSVPPWGGMATLAAGILLAALPLGDLLDLPEDFFFLLALPIVFFFLIGLPGIRARQGGRDGAVGTVGYIVLAISLAILTMLFAIGTFVTFALNEDVETFLPDWLAWIWFLVKVFLILFFYVWMRWTLPRYRYDQLMEFGWKVLLPVGVLNLLATAALILWMG